VPRKPTYRRLLAPRALAPLALGALLSWPFVGVAEEGGKWALCPVGPTLEIDDPLLEEEAAEAPDALHLFADDVEERDDGTTHFKGEVEVRYKGKRLSAHEALYQSAQEQLDIQGEVSFSSGDMSFSGQRAQLDLASEESRVTTTHFFIRDLHAYGSAASVEMPNSQLTRLHRVVYTTCSPQHQDWQMEARELDLDRASNTGEIRDVTVTFQDVPLIYLPYLNFPLQGRKSGLLVPTFGTSELSGTDIRIPYYWNIAPDRDATFTPRIITKRGTMLLSEGRYLNATNHGELQLDYLADDALYSEDRLRASLHHATTFAGRWQADLEYNYVSDVEYFDDLEFDQGSSSQTHLPRRLNINYQGRQWAFQGRLEGFQTLSGDRPYQRLPQLRLAYTPVQSPGRLHLSLNGELTHFDIDSEGSSGLLPTGQRLDLRPDLTLPLRGAAWSLTPRVGLRHTEYRLRDYSESAISRTLPVGSLDATLALERDTQWGRRPLVQTLEPHLYYLYVPYEEQSGIPVFDSGPYDFSFSQLFRDNRFSGADRIGDAKQLAVTLTSRLLDARHGNELGRASIGQVHYFDARRVTLPGGIGDATSASDLVGELAASPLKGLNLSASARWDPEGSRAEMVTGRIGYRAGRERVVNFTYRLRRDEDIRQTDLAGYWPLTRHYRLLGRWNYDLVNERSLESVVGLEYQRCCWSVRVVGRGRLNTTTREIDHSLYFTLELKGLASFGQQLEEELERGILGYE